MVVIIAVVIVVIDVNNLYSVLTQLRVVLSLPQSAGRPESHSGWLFSEESSSRLKNKKTSSSYQSSLSIQVDIYTFIFHEQIPRFCTQFQQNDTTQAVV